MITNVGHFTDSTGNGMEALLQGIYPGVTFYEGSVGGESAIEIKTRFFSSAAAAAGVGPGRPNIIRAGHNKDPDITSSSQLSIQVERNKTAIKAMTDAGSKSMVLQLGMSSKVAYSTPGGTTFQQQLFYMGKQLRTEMNAWFAATYPPEVYCHIHDKLLDRARLLPDLSAQDITDINAELLPYRWRGRVGDGGANDGHYDTLGREQASQVIAEHINQYNFLEVAGGGGGPPPPPPPPPVITIPVRRADDVAANFGMNTHFTFQNASDPNSYQKETIDLLIEMGIRLVRERIAPGNAVVRAAIGRLHAARIRTILPLMTLSGVPTIDAARALVTATLDEVQNNPTVYDIGMIESFAGLNEPNGDAATYPDWATRTRNAQQALYEEVRARPYFNGVAVQGPPLSKPIGARVVAPATWQSVLTADVAALGNLSPYTDKGDAHCYPGNFDPINGDQAEILGIIRGMYPAGEPITVSEAGYTNSTAADGVTYTGGGRATPKDSTAIYMPKLPLENSLLGLGPICAYEMLDNPPPYADTDRGTRESTFGFIATPTVPPSSWTKKPVFETMKRFLAIMNDPGPAFIPMGRSLSVSAPGNPADLHAILFQRRNGSHVLALWRSVDVWNYSPATNTGSYNAIAPVAVTVTMTDPTDVVEYRPSTQAAAIRTLIDVSSFVTNVAEQVHLMELSNNAATQADYDYFIFAGQSLVFGGPLSGPSLLTTPQYPATVVRAEHVTPNAGVLKPLVSGYYETYDREYPSVEFGFSVHRQRPAKKQIVNLHAKGGGGYLEIAKGGVFGKYEEAVDTYAAARTANPSSTMEAVAVHVIHGEADADATPETYAGWLYDWQADFQTDLRAIDGTTDALPMLFCQVNRRFNMTKVQGAAMGQVIAHRASAKHWLVGAKYQLPYVVNPANPPTNFDLHLTNRGSVFLGELHARAWKSVRDTGSWQPVIPKAITYLGNKVTAVFHVPAPPLSFDTTVVAAQPNMGFVLKDASGVVPISSVILGGTDSVVVTAGRDLVSPVRLEYGMTSVKVGNLRDSEPAMSVYEPTYPLANWCVWFSDPVDKEQAVVPVPGGGGIPVPGGGGGEPGTPSATAAPVKFSLFHVLTGEPMGTIDPSSFAFNDPLNANGELNCKLTIPQDVKATMSLRQILIPDVTAIFVSSGSNILFDGIVNYARPNDGYTQLDIKAQKFRAWSYSRKFAFEGVMSGDEFVVATDILKLLHGTEFLGWPKIALPRNIFSGRVRELTIQAGWSGGQALDEFGDVDDGFEWSTSGRIGKNGLPESFYELWHAGQTRSARNLVVYDSSAITNPVSMEAPGRDTTTRLSKVFAQGEGSFPDRAMAWDEDPEGVTGKVLRREAIITISGVTDPAVLFEYARKARLDSMLGSRIIKITQGTANLNNFRSGDRCRVINKNLWESVDVAGARIIDKAVSKDSGSPVRVTVLVDLDNIGV